MSREEVVWAYRCIFGREPENESVVENHRRGHYSLSSLRNQFLTSEEFASSLDFAKNFQKEERRDRAPRSNFTADSRPTILVQNFHRSATIALIRDFAEIGLRVVSPDSNWFRDPWYEPNSGLASELISIADFYKLPPGYILIACHPQEYEMKQLAERHGDKLILHVAEQYDFYHEGISDTLLCPDISTYENYPNTSMNKMLYFYRPHLSDVGYKDIRNCYEAKSVCSFINRPFAWPRGTEAFNEFCRHYPFEVKQHGIGAADGVLDHGSCNRKMIQSMFTVHFKESEAYGLTCLESMMLGTPVITLKKFIDDKTLGRYFFDETTAIVAETIEEAIDRVLTMSLDKYSAMSDNCRKRVMDLTSAKNTTERLKQQIFRNRGAILNSPKLNLRAEQYQKEFLFQEMVESHKQIARLESANHDLLERLSGSNDAADHHGNAIRRANALYQSDQTFARMLNTRTIVVELLKRVFLIRIAYLYWDVHDLLKRKKINRFSPTYETAEALVAEATSLVSDASSTSPNGESARLLAATGRNSMPEPRHFAEVCRPRIMVDVTQTAESTARSGIQRYVRNFARRSAETGLALPIIMADGALYDAYRPSERIRAEAGDVLLLLDAHWVPENADMTSVINEIKTADGRVVGFFHDVIPLSYPFTCAPGLPATFSRWFHYIMPKVDALITSTSAGATAIERQLHRHCIADIDVPIGWIAPPVGLDPRSLDNEEVRVSDEIRQIFDSSPVFVSVGTIEPRKGYQVAIDAFDQIWKEEDEIKYLIIGETGWSMKNFERTIDNHPKRGTLLFRLSECSDDDLIFAYKNAHRLVACSIEEGFGMPLLEAGVFGLPVICSDIAVFREVLIDQPADFFATANASDLAVKLRDSLDHPPTRQIKSDPGKLANVGPMTTMIRDRLYQSRIRSAVGCA